MDKSNNTPWARNLLEIKKGWVRFPKELPQPAPDYWSKECLRSSFGEKNFYTSQYAHHDHPFLHQKAPFDGERMPPYIFMNPPGHINCLGNSFLNPWGEKQAYTAHLGWENG